MSTTPLPLEDRAVDILGKAQRGKGLSDAALCAAASISAAELASSLEGNASENVLRKLARSLDLSGDALLAAAVKEWRPLPRELAGLATFTTPFEDMTVNAYLVWDPTTGDSAAFDSGADASGMLDYAREHGLSIRSIFITHTHGDHIFDLDRLIEKTGARAFVGDREPHLPGAEAFSAGCEFRIGNLTVETRLTWGHAEGGITYVVRGLEKPLAIVGDAIFAGSMGGGKVSWSDALRTVREEILTLPDETILASGHGPLTTVGEEKVHNPFFAA